MFIIIKMNSLVISNILGQTRLREHRNDSKQVMFGNNRDGTLGKTVGKVFREVCLGLCMAFLGSARDWLLLSKIRQVQVGSG